MNKQYLLVFTFLFIYVKGFPQTWTRCSNGLPAIGAMSLTKCGNSLFAGTDKMGVYRSDDNGDNWYAAPSYPSFTSSSTWCIASIDTFIFAGQRGHGIFRISLHGTEWTLMNSGIPNRVIQDLIAVGNTLYIATYGGGVLVSADLGNSWNGIKTGMNDYNCFSLAANKDYLFTGTAGRNNSMDTGVAFRIPRFNGTSWTKIDSGFIPNGAHLEGVFAMDANDSLVFAGTDDVGIFRSTDFGTHWKSIGTYNGDIHAIKIVGDKVFYGTTWSGVYTSDDKGLSFKANNSGLKNGSTSIPYLVKDFYADYTTQQIYTATDIGIFKQAVVVPKPAGIKPIEAIQVSISPNPGNGNFWIRSETEIKSLAVTNLHGELVLLLNPNQSNFKIDLTGISNGVYFVSMFDGARVMNQKVMVLR